MILNYIRHQNSSVKIILNNFFLKKYEKRKWISAKVKIQNPHFGVKILTCGTVKATIDKYFKNPPMKQASNARQNSHNH